ncbi:GNAT family N-acetyltransferase [Spirosoma pollinicola]|uniref:GNAT family N-acetyltransferase n=2 Tax=Spirosoma pollinicola TaxID=2057025 RepID=A0A2K8ZC95_9BACT|nr:GNAT family N-acetyltransferase [Spirosoma pollinicola]
MPIPLRRKRIVGINYSWVVHQPFFCQFLGVFSPGETIDFTPFLRLIQQKFRYGSTFCLRQQPDESRSFSSVRMASTQCLDLSVGYNTIYENYTRDRKQNLKRAVSANWTVADSTDPVPLSVLFQENHEAGIEGGVAVWAYNSLQNLIRELIARNLITLRYACRNGRIEAGALFVQEGNRIIYLFNSASEVGRRGNARTLLIDQVIREHAGSPLLFDFESPEKPSIREFYQSFGASEEPFYEVRWNRLNFLERTLRQLLS